MAGIDSDHNPVVAELEIQLKTPWRKNKAVKQPDITAFKEPDIAEKYRIEVCNKYEVLMAEGVE